jgi:hypothetical protein
MRNRSAKHRVRDTSGAALLLATCVLALACNAGPSDDALGAERATRLSAARAGIDWLVQHVDEMPPGWAHTYLLRLHRLAPDDATAANIEAALRADPGGRRATHLPRRIGVRGVLETRRLIPLLFELARRRDLGIPIRKEIDAFRPLLESDGGRFWEPIKPTQRLVLLHLFEEVGLETPRDLEQTVRDLKVELEQRPPEDVATDEGMLFTLTHVIMAESGYFRERPDPQRVAFVIPHLLHGLDAALEGGESAPSLDLTAEIVGCLTFVGVSADERIDDARAWILDAQNEDGSWGEGQGVTAPRIHLTLNAVTATIDWPERPRPDPGLRI